MVIRSINFTFRFTTLDQYSPKALRFPVCISVLYIVYQMYNRVYDMLFTHNI